jgi:surfactin synthase thioesterase subunit
LPGNRAPRKGHRRPISELGDVSVLAAIRDLAGHDLTDLSDALRQADEAEGRPR